MKKIIEEKIKKELLKDIKKLTSPKGFLWAGFPHFKTLFGRDSLISAWQMLPFNPQIAKDTLRILSKYQGKRINWKKEEEPGKILHEYRTPADRKYWLSRFEHFKYWGFPYYGSVDSTILFVIVAAKYFEKTCDQKFIKRIWPNLKKALNWIEKYGDLDKDGFIEYERKNPKGLYHQGWKDSTQNHLRITSPAALVEIQGYTYLAYKEGAKLAILLKEKKIASILKNKALGLKRKFNQKFWQGNFHALALDGKKKAMKSVSSNQGHLLFTGIINDKKKEKKLVERLFKQDMWTSYGIRTLSSKDKHFNPFSYHLGSVWPHDNWMIYTGLKKCGYQKEAQKIKKALLKTYQKIGYIPEYYTVKKGVFIPYLRRACHPQAWASAALLNMIINNHVKDKNIKT